MKKIKMHVAIVQVLEISLLPGKTEEVHHHCWPNVLYIQETEDFIDTNSDGNIIMDCCQMKPSLKFQMTIPKDAEAPHSV